MSENNGNSKEDKEIILRVNSLKKIYDNILAVDDLSFSIREGEIYGLLGPNGAGKTTTIKAILGMINVDRGNINLMGYNPVRDPKEVKSRIGYVAEQPMLYDSLTTRELINFISSIRKLDPVKMESRVKNLLASLDALKYFDSIIATLSKGNKQKLQIVIALMHNPELLILDEPLSGLDAKSRRIVRNILQFHLKSGKSILLSTHAMEDAQGLCHRIGIINKGRMIAEGNLEELKEQSREREDSTLEDIFLQLTQQEESVASATSQLEAAYGFSGEGAIEDDEELPENKELVRGE